jgi:hypothetical protein
MADSKGKAIASLFILAAIVPSWYLWGWCFVTLWGWYFVPMGLPVVGMLQAAGMSAVVGLFRLSMPEVKTAEQIKAEEEETAGKYASRAFGVMLAPLCVLLFGYLIGLLGGFA